MKGGARHLAAPELKATLRALVSERQGRTGDRRDGASLKQKKPEGYF